MLGKVQVIDIHDLYNDNIETPPDDYTPNKVGEVSLDKLQQDRVNDLSNKK